MIWKWMLTTTAILEVIELEDSLDFHFPLSEIYHGVEETHFFCLLEVFWCEVGFLDDAGFQKLGTLGSLEQRMLGGEPFLAIKKGEVGEGGVCYGRFLR